MEPLERREGDRLLLVTAGSESTGGFWLVHGEDAWHLSEAELRWLVTTAGPAVLPRREPVR